MFSHVLDTWHGGKEAAGLGLVGEIGELVDLYKKDKYKPNRLVTPQVYQDELGDVGYYLGICAWYADDKEWTKLSEVVLNPRPFSDDLPPAFIFGLMLPPASRVMIWSTNKEVGLPLDSVLPVAEIWALLCPILGKASPQEIMARNKEKLAGGKHGWPAHSQG